jgi:transcriptional regulator with XRE-family HTH domain
MDVATNGAWTHVADHIQRRMTDLGLTQAEVARRSNVSAPTVRAIVNGKPRGGTTAASKSRLATALEWSPDSIDRILAGDEPVTVTPRQPIDEVREALQHLADQVADSRRALEDRSRQIDHRLDGLAADVRRLAARALDPDPE